MLNLRPFSVRVEDVSQFRNRRLSGGVTSSSQDSRNLWPLAVSSRPRGGLALWETSPWRASARHNFTLWLTLGIECTRMGGGGRVRLCCVGTEAETLYRSRKPTLKWMLAGGWRKPAHY